MNWGLTTASLKDAPYQLIMRGIFLLTSITGTMIWIILSK
jgi:hypothetical protein